MRFLSGAVFEMYEDTNGDQKFDSGDKLLGNLTETDAGFHTVENLLAKGYFVKEKSAPEGGYLCDIFAAFEAKPKESSSDTSPWRMEWKDDGAYTTWLSAMADRSVVETDVTVTSSDKVLTLSTCTPGGASRFIVMGKLTEADTETE